MSAVHQLRGEEETSRILADQQSRLQAAMQENVVGGGGPPHNGDMEKRLTKLETQFETVIPTLATKSDLGDVRSEISALKVDMHKGFADMIKWIIGTAIVMAGAGITIMTFVLNNAAPKSAPPTQPPPVIINIPAPPQPAQSK